MKIHKTGKVIYLNPTNEEKYPLIKLAKCEGFQWKYTKCTLSNKWDKVNCKNCLKMKK